ncbi:MAG: VOC family protein [Nocardioides sp.]|nr:VOC family protein [Nocardioides sp.]
MTKILHVKLPVTDLQHSVDWYAALMDLHLTHEFIEDGELRGAALRSARWGAFLSRCGYVSTARGSQFLTASMSCRCTWSTGTRSFE